MIIGLPWWLSGNSHTNTGDMGSITGQENLTCLGATKAMGHNY